MYSVSDLATFDYNVLVDRYMHAFKFSSSEPHKAIQKYNLWVPDDFKKLSNSYQASLLRKLWPKECMLAGFVPTRVIGSGSYGTAYIGCKQKKCEYVMKFTSLRSDSKGLSKNAKKILWEQEVKYQKQAASFHIAPQVYANGLCSFSTKYPFGIIVMQKMDNTLANLVAKLEYEKKVKDLKALFARVIDLISDLHTKTNLFHNDLHIDNILYKYVDKNRLILRVSDYGLSKISRSKKQLLYDYAKFLASWNEMAPTIFDNANVKDTIKILKNKGLHIKKLVKIMEERYMGGIKNFSDYISSKVSPMIISSPTKQKSREIISLKSTSPMNIVSSSSSGSSRRTYKRRKMKS